MKGIKLNYENSNVVNFAALRNMILEYVAPVHVHNPKKIKRKQGSVVVSEQETKEYKIVLRSAGLWTTLTLCPRVMINLFCLFILGSVQ